MQMMRSQVATIDVQADAALTFHTASGQYESQGDAPDDAMDGGSNEEEPEDEIPEDEISEDAIMGDRRPDITIIDLPHSDVAPTEYRWRQCAVFMESKWSGPLSKDPLNARLPEGARMVIRCMEVCKNVITRWRIMLEF